MTTPQPECLARPRKGNKHAEFRLHCAVAGVIREFIRPGWKATHLPFGEYRPPETAGRLKRMGVEKGWPDFLLVGPGKTCFLELKSSNGSMTPEQRDVAAHLIMCGCGYGLAHSFKDAVGMLKDWGVIPLAVHP